jgi:hypothetical protein
VTTVLPVGSAERPNSTAATSNTASVRATPDTTSVENLGLTVAPRLAEFYMRVAILRKSQP